jgi:release factor glutamine methyltransferase
MMKKIIEVKAKELFNYILKEILETYDELEAKANVYYLLYGRLMIDKTAIIANQTISVKQEIMNTIHEDIVRLKLHEPVQYITGFSEFYELTVKVNPHVLIPRPETEELVDLIAEEHGGKALKILDIGTGSGCIALALKSKMPSSQIYATDISNEALIIANESAMINKLHVHFMLSDILKENLPYHDFDLWVSNPPYVMESEKALMHENVLKYEPATALFVPDHDPLVYYRAILKKGHGHLKEGGKVYFEINEALGQEMLELIKKEGYVEGKIIKDLNGKDRIAVATKTDSR